MGRTALTMLFVLSGTGWAASRCARAEVRFVQDVRPILKKHCYRCHGASKQKSGLRLDIKQAAFRGGDGYGPAIVPGDAAESPLIQFVSDPDADSPMPPEGDRLTSEEIATLTKWVEQGAVWPEGVDTAKLVDKRDHWSFRPIRRPAVPAARDSSWPRNAIDHFILRRLEKQGLSPAPPADRLVWLRRVYFDLIGLPPTPEQVDAFLSDQRSGAYERVVNELLGSPRYGERWAQHWLDVVRYADTHGFEVNTPRENAWPYRDYVIRALNRDTPYDQFVRQQLAGDTMGEPAATGFLVTAAVLLPGQIGKDDASKRLARQDELGEIVINAGGAFLGLSIGCARCHDHKFDPLSMRDYYSMQAFFSGVYYGDRPIGSDAAATNRKVYAGVFKQPESVYVLHRGDPEQPRDEVLPAVPTALGSLKLDRSASDAQRRAALADWIADRNNPLTARVMVNRIWQGHFGIGLVETSNDFGRSGTPPSHPELLDYLATEFISGGWSIKRMHRLIVLSATYRQSSRIDPAAMAKDSGVRLLWRFPSRRLSAETIRDSMLSVSGRLNLKAGGPGFDLFRSRGGLSGFPPIETFEGDGLRRMIYAHKIRMERDIVFGAFDCPDAGRSTDRRRQSTTPIQALNLFNSRFTIDTAEAFAERVRREVGNDPARQVRRAYRRALGRLPDSQEVADALPVVRQHGLATLCRALFNCNEFLFMP